MKYLQGKGDMVTWWLLGKDKQETGSETIAPYAVVPRVTENNTLSEEQTQDPVTDDVAHNDIKQIINNTNHMSDDKIFTPVELPGTRN